MMSAGRWLFAGIWLAVLAFGCAGTREDTMGHQAIRERQTYEQEEVLREAQRFFGVGAAQLASVVERAFSERGRPTGFIAGEEAAGAFVFGLRYGRGVLRLRGGQEAPVYWQGPSLGFDVGGNASKVFVLVYELYDPDLLYRRFPGVDGSLYFVGGFGMTLHRRGELVLAPIRLGMGWRQGASIGYLKLTSGPSLFPF